MKWNLINTKKTISLLVGILCILPLLGNAQNDNDNHRKYWYYRSRLVNDFLKVGTGQGESMPFNQRGLYASGFNPYFVDLNIGDGTSTLGYYIGLLATEYYLLQQNNQNTDKVKHELFCALNAINRLDAVAESLDPNNPTALNGFFVRDDISKNFVRDNYNHFNYFDNGGNSTNTVNSRGFASKFNMGAQRSLSSWKSAVEDVVKHDTLFYESQDQVYNLLFGIALVNKFVPSSETDGSNIFGYGSGESSLTTEARNIAGRIIDNVRDTKNSTTGQSCGGALATGWKIYRPTTCTPVLAGAQAEIFAYPLAELEGIIKNGMSSNTGTNFSLGSIPKVFGNNYHNLWSRTLGYSAWNAYVPSNVIKVDNRVFAENLAAACNCVYGTVLDQILETIQTELHQIPFLGFFGDILFYIVNIVTQTIYTLIPGMIKNITETAINVNAYLPDAPIDHGPLARKVLHGGLYMHNPANTIDYLLNVAPCDDIYAFAGGYFGNQQWSSTDRLDHPERMWGSGHNNDFYGEYPAIDYMLYHNLWYIHQKQEGTSQNIVDLSDIKIYNQNGLPCHNVNAYETIDAQNTTVACFNPTVWRAGKTIYFGSGVSITGNGSTTSGPNFHAYIQKFDCATDVGVFRMANPNDSTGQEPNSMSNDSYANGVRFHTVNYPEQMAVLNTEPITEHNQNLITELPTEESPLDAMLKAANPGFSRELFVKPTVTKDEVSAYFLLADNETGFITVMDLGGKVVYNNNTLKQMDSGVSIDLSSFAAGTYILKFTTTNGTNKTQKIIKE